MCVNVNVSWLHITRSPKSIMWIILTLSLDVTVMPCCCVCECPVGRSELRGMVRIEKNKNTPKNNWQDDLKHNNFFLQNNVIIRWRKRALSTCLQNWAILSPDFPIRVTGVLAPGAQNQKEHAAQRPIIVLVISNLKSIIKSKCDTDLRNIDSHPLSPLVPQ